VASSARSAADGLLAVLLSPSCASCGTALDAPTRGPVCPACWAQVRRVPAPFCDVCGEPLASWRAEAGARCARCRRGTRAVDRTRAGGLYDGSLRAIVHALKYEGRRSLARPLAALMRAREDGTLTGAHAVVPVPLHPARQCQRGFNQATDLARALGIPVVRALRRTRATAAQSCLAAGHRHRNVRGAFSLTRAAARLRGATVVLVDDVCTTGATLDACARALKAGGVAEVRAITVARAGPGRE
jgi:ComF family protein